MEDLQDDVTVSDNRISGTLHYVDDYTGYSEDTELQSGHYLALKFEATEGADITVQLIGGETDSDPVEVDDEDMNVVIRIEDPSVQRLKVASTLDGHSDYAKVYRMTGLVLEAASENNSAELDNGGENNSVVPGNGNTEG